MIKRKPRYYLEKSLRRFIQEGVAVSLPNAIPQSSIIMANDSVKSPDGLFATLQYIGESRSSPFFYQKGEELWVQQAIHARYLVCFLRTFDSWEGVEASDRTGDRLIYTSYDAAQAFVDFVESYRGMGWSSNAVTDGTLRKVYVYQTSSDGYPAGAMVNPTTFNPPEDLTRSRGVQDNDIVLDPPVDGLGNAAGNPARIRLYASSNGKIESGFVVNYGSGYKMGKEVSIPVGWSEKITNGDADRRNYWPTITAVGGGFTVDNPLMIEEDDYPRDDNVVERRCMIEMDISFLEDRKEKEVRTVSRYELGVDWIQSIKTFPHKLELRQGGESKLLAISLHREPSTAITVHFGDDINFAFDKSPITITPEDWNAPHYVNISATPTANATELEIFTKSFGRSEDIVETRIPIVITPA